METHVGNSYIPTIHHPPTHPTARHRRPDPIDPQVSLDMPSHFPPRYPDIHTVFTKFHMHRLTRTGTHMHDPPPTQDCSCTHTQLHTRTQLPGRHTYRLLHACTQFPWCIETSTHSHIHRYAHARTHVCTRGPPQPRSPSLSESPGT